MPNHNDLHILVVAPQFPSINQPWMDTYLEQLCLRNIDFGIYSRNLNKTNYQPKVDKLKLLNKIILTTEISLKGCIETFISSPLRFTSGLLKKQHPKLIETEGHITSKLKTALFYSQVSLASIQINLIHCHDEVYAFHFIYLAKILDCKLILTFHGLPPTGVPHLSKEKRNLLFKSCAAIFVNTVFSKNELISLGCPRENIQVLPQGLPIELFPYQQKTPPNIKTKLKLLSIGRFQREKGQHYVIFALKRVLEEGIVASLDLVGVGEEWLPRLKHYCIRLGIENHVYFHSNLTQTEIASLFKESHLFILASTSNKGKCLTETQGVVLQEAQASGCPPIATRVGGIPECIEHNHNGLLVKERSSRSISKAILKVIKDQNLYTSLAKNGRLNVEKNYRADLIGEQMVDALNSTL